MTVKGFYTCVKTLAAVTLVGGCTPKNATHKAETKAGAKPDTFYTDYMASLGGCAFYDWYALSNQNADRFLKKKGDAFGLTDELFDADLRAFNAEVLNPRNTDNKLHIGNEQMIAFSHSIELLLQRMTNRWSVSLKALSQAAEAELKKRQAAGQIGDCTQIHYTEVGSALTVILGKNTVAFKSVELSPARINAIDAAFKVDTLVTMPLNENETEATTVLKASNGQAFLTKEEVNELRILRRVSQAYEFYVDLNRDLAKGFDTNVLDSSLKDSHQLNCANEAETSRQMVVMLQRRGLLKYFEIDGKSSDKLDRPYLLGEEHTGLKIRNKRTKESIIFDSWFEKGGQPSHILKVEHWQGGKIGAIGVKTDKTGKVAADQDLVQVANISIDENLR